MEEFPPLTPDELERQRRELDAAWRQMTGRSIERLNNLNPFDAFYGLYPDQRIDQAKVKSTSPVL